MTIDVYVKDQLIEAVSHANGVSTRAILKIDPLAPPQEYYMDFKETFLFYGIELTGIEKIRVFADNPAMQATVCSVIGELTGIMPVKAERTAKDD